ncbi:MAG: hypothetical protein K0R25_644 [Rickettsiaceae bacterium]|jgi:prepilin-type N-terminal cleavage/methylation domain-containing protein|nr:hypothetical protein [Rickettsiaceae bacterium]
MKKTQAKSAFSLIELSVVILLIGILVLGVVKGSSIIRRAKLSSAISLTKASPVNTTENLLLWLDTTSDDAFTATEKMDGGKISNWYNTSLQATDKTGGAQGGATSLKPTYVADGINNLPALSFNGTSNYLLTKNITTGDYTVFIVLKTQHPGPGTAGGHAFTGSGILSADVSGGANDVIPLSITAGYAKTFVGAPGLTVTSTNTINDNKANIVTVTRSLSSGLLSLYVNGANGVSATGTAGVSLTTPANLGIGVDVVNARYYQGFLSEIIIFNRVLSPSERTNIENYLKDKWGIK